MAKRLIFICGLVVLGLAWVQAFGADSAATTTTTATTTTAAAAAKAGDSVKRDPAATDEVFSPQYQAQVNAAQQAADEQSRQDRARHEKMIDEWMRGF
jgi:hypothetical protein